MQQLFVNKNIEIRYCTHHIRTVFDFKHHTSPSDKLLLPQFSIAVHCNQKWSHLRVKNMLWKILELIKDVKICFNPINPPPPIPPPTISFAFIKILIFQCFSPSSRTHGKQSVSSLLQSRKMCVVAPFRNV